MSFPPLAGGDHTILSSEYCSGYTDITGIWNTGFYCPQTGSTLAVYCCGTPSYKYCCTTKPNVTGIITERGGGTEPEGNNFGATTDGGGDNDYSGATRMRPSGEENDFGGFNTDLSSLNLSDVPIIFGVACGVAAVLILVILAGFYLTSCCAHYHQLHQNRKRRSSVPGLYRDAVTTNASTASGLVNLYSPTNSCGDRVLDNSQGYPLHHHGANSPASPDSSENYQVGGGSASLVTTPLDIEWSSTAQYLQQRLPQKVQQGASSSTSQHLNLLSNHINDTGSTNSPLFYPTTADHRIHYTVHQTQNRLAVALSGSMNRLSDRPSPCPTAYQVNIPLTPPDAYGYPRSASQPVQQSQRGLSPPPQYSASLLSRSESPPYYPYDSGSSSNTDNQQLNYLNRTCTLPLSLSRKQTPLGSNRPSLTSPGPYTNFPLLQQQPKSILRTSQNYRRVVTNETPPPVPPHSGSGSELYSGGPDYLTSSGYSVGGPNYNMECVPGGGNVAYRNVDSRSNLNQPLLLLENKVENQMIACVEDDDITSEQLDCINVRRTSSSGIVDAPEEEDESRDQFDIHDIDSDALSRLIELDLDSKL